MKDGRLNLCQSCGRFRKHKEIIGVQGEYNERWTECAFCTSDVDYECYLKQDLGDREEYLKTRE